MLQLKQSYTRKSLLLLIVAKNKCTMYYNCMFTVLVGVSYMSLNI